MRYRYRTECPICNLVDEVEVEKSSPRLHCGDCLMDRTELVVLTCTIMRQQETE